MKIDFKNNKFRKHLYNHLINCIKRHCKVELKNALLLEKKYINNNDLLKIYFALENSLPEWYSLDPVIFNFYILQKGGFKKFNKILFEELGKNIFTFKDNLYFKLKYSFFINYNNEKSLFLEIINHLNSFGCDQQKSYLAIQRFIKE